jgi:hypothetical protein
MLVFYASLTSMRLPCWMEADETQHWSFSIDESQASDSPPSGEKVRLEETMKSNVAFKLALIAFAGICAAMPSWASQSQARADASAVNITGQVSCSRFGRGAVTARKGMSVAQTIQYCVTFQGADYTLVSGNKIYRLSGDKNMLAKVSGQTVTVAGRMLPEQTDVATVALMGTVAVSDIAPAKE